MAAATVKENGNKPQHPIFILVIFNTECVNPVLVVSKIYTTRDQ